MILWPEADPSCTVTENERFYISFQQPWWKKMSTWRVRIVNHENTKMVAANLAWHAVIKQRPTTFRTLTLRSHWLNAESTWWKSLFCIITRVRWACGQSLHQFLLSMRLTNEWRANRSCVLGHSQYYIHPIFSPWATLKQQQKTLVKTSFSDAEDRSFMAQKQQL